MYQHALPRSTNRSSFLVVLTSLNALTDSIVIPHDATPHRGTEMATQIHTGQLEVKWKVLFKQY